MELEQRYHVIKIADADLSLTTAEKSILKTIMNKVADGRKNAGKPPLHCLCIEGDWPEYEPALKLISDRVDLEEAALFVFSTLPVIQGAEDEPTCIKPEVGMCIQRANQHGGVFDGVITKIEPDSISVSGSGHIGLTHYRHWHGKLLSNEGLSIIKKQA